MPRVPDKDILIYIYIYYITVCIVQVLYWKQYQSKEYLLYYNTGNQTYLFTCD